MDSVFRREENIELDIILSGDRIGSMAEAMLNGMAESRYDGKNAAYVNNMQFELERARDYSIVDGAVSSAVYNIARRIEPYVTWFGEYDEPSEESPGGEQGGEQGGGGTGRIPGMDAPIHTISEETTRLRSYEMELSMPHSWKATMEDALAGKMHEYVTMYMLSEWFRLVSPNDHELAREKAKGLLREIKGICELRNGMVHRKWNTTY